MRTWRMKRPPGLWLLLSAGVLCLSLQDVFGIRASALIFAKTTTSTTTTPSTTADGVDSSPVSSQNSTEEGVTEATSNSTKPPLTGNPQIDYIYDPNLPQELNGYNLSNYPFYERVPAEIDFKCDGLHDGFYASILHKCQVYHHCLYGQRFDFLCANYTAFDQKTFICQFVSVVDCVNSKKFWHRNDALYEPASTTTIKSTFVYTPPAQPPAILNPQRAPADPARPLGSKRRRPPSRRPQYDYYDDEVYQDDYEYEERPRSRRRRPRPRPRPIYDDEYDDFEDDRYERRNRRPPYNRRGSDSRRRYKNRSKYDDKTVEDDYESDKTENQEKRKPNNEEKKISNNRRNEKNNSEDDKSEKEILRKRDRRPTDEEEYEDDSAPSEKRKSNDKDRPRKSFVESKKSTTTSTALPEDLNPVDKPSRGVSIFNKPRAAPRIKPPVPKNEAKKYEYKPAVSSKPFEDEEYYDEDYEEEPLPKQTKPNKPNQRKPETIPEERTKSKSFTEEKDIAHSEKRIRTASKSQPANNKKKQYNDYEEEEEEYEMPKIKDKTQTRRPFNKKRTDESDVNPRTYRPHVSKSEINIPEKIEQPTLRARPSSKESDSMQKESKEESNNKNVPLEEYYDEEYDDIKSSQEIKPATVETTKKTIKWRPSTLSPSTSTAKSTTSTTTTTTAATAASFRRSKTTTTTTTEQYKEKNDQIVRTVKRPFLPSRGGSPYLSRGLQPVGSKSLDKKLDPMEQQSSDDNNQKALEDYNSAYTSRPVKNDEIEETKDNVAIDVENQPIKFKPSPVIMRVSASGRIAQQSPTRTYQTNEYTGPRTTQKPKILDRNPLDIITANEYDVTLNDALNPTLPNLPIRSFPSGYNDYAYNNYNRNRYVLDPIVNAANNDYTVYQAKPVVRQRYEPIQQDYHRPRQQYITANNNQYNSFNEQLNQPPNTRNRLVQAESQIYYSII